MIDPPRGARLAEEARDVLGVLAVLAQHPLQSHAPLGHLVHRAVNDTHAAAPEHAVDAVLPRDEVAGRRLTVGPYRAAPAGHRLMVPAARPSATASTE